MQSATEPHDGGALRGTRRRPAWLLGAALHPAVAEAVLAAPAVDHHVHGFRRDAVPMQAETFRRLFTESDFAEIHATHVPGQVAYRWGVRLLWAHLVGPGTAPDADAEDLERELRRRWGGRPFRDYATALLRDAGVEAMLVDDGIWPEQMYTCAELAQWLPCTVRRVLRLEAVAGELLPDAASATDLRDALIAVIRREAERPGGIVGLKSIAAYRTGLDVQRSDAASAQAAFRRVKEEAERAWADAGGSSAGPRRPVRLADKPLNDWLLWGALEEAARQELPVQFHVGHGDRDADLRLSNPLHLRAILEEPKFRRVPIVLLHNYPYVGEAAYLAHIYPNVFGDVSLAIPQAGALAGSLIAEFLGLASTRKLLFASDAHSLPEFHWLGNRLWRRSLGEVLSRLVEQGFLDAREAVTIVHDVMAGNARRVYTRLPVLT